MWYEFSTSTIIGPIFFQEMHDCVSVTVSVTVERYANILQNHIILSLADNHLLESIIFMQNDAPPRIARRVKDVLRMSFG